MTFVILFFQVDVDGSGEIDFEEFCDLMLKTMQKVNPEKEVHKIPISCS